MKKFIAICLSVFLFSTQPARADLFGGDGVPRMARV